MGSNAKKRTRDVKKVVDFVQQVVYTKENTRGLYIV